MEEAQYYSLAEFKEISAQFDRSLSAGFAKFDRALVESAAKFSRALAESADRLRRELAAIAAGGDRQIAEDRRELAFKRAEDDRERAVRAAEFDRDMAARDAESDRRWATRDVKSGCTSIEWDGWDRKLKMSIFGTLETPPKEYFFESLQEKLTFAGIRFDDADDWRRGRRAWRDRPSLEDYFDIVLTHDEAVAIIMVERKASMTDLEILANRKVENFKIMYPEYQGHRFYLGLGGVTFEDGVAEAA